ncbi:MAG: hypothetical protein J7K65_02215 [Planctomycetes bacterium]|nr:hypothetical protein [Planctomycetota bacterium]
MPSHRKPTFTEQSQSPRVLAAVSESEFEIAGQQYWLHVRAIRGNEAGQWSDPTVHADIGCG